VSVSFADLGVPTNLVDRLRARGITDSFPIQEAAIPDALAGRDVVGKAATGSGKTLAFGLPMLARLGTARPRQPLGLILVPTRELASQVQKELAQLTNDRGRRIITIFGGTSYNTTRKALNAGVDLVVACPGRLEDLLEQRALDLSAVTTVVVDEADRMADMGFLPAVRRIVGATPSDRHVMLFSATMGPDVATLVNTFTHDAIIHDVVGDEAPSDVDHYFWRVARDQRPQVTADIVEQYERAIVFTRTKHGADRLARQLGERGVSSVALHGDRTQAQRERALRAMKNGETRVLVATDVAARGIHIDLLPVVVHYDPPTQATDYLHRSGRTGRAGATGAVISLVSDDVAGHVKRMQRSLGIPTTLDDPQNATAIRLGAVDDAAAAQSLDERPRSRSSRPAESNRRDSADRPASRFGERTRERSETRRSRTATTESRGETRSPRTSRDEFRSDASRPADRSTSRAPREQYRELKTSGATKRSAAGHAVVSFFNDSKGFGFASDEKGDDLFIHFSNIVGDGFKTLSQGQTIAYDEATGPKGREARNVRVVTGGARHR